jgi:hypothetical protein
MSASEGKQSGQNPCQKIVLSNNLNKKQKIKELRKYLEAPVHSAIPALSWMDVMDPEAAIATAKEYFNRKRIDKEKKLEVGRWLTQKGDRDTIPKFKKFLVDEIASNIGEFMKLRTQNAITAVGEYCCMAEGFNGYDKTVFETFKDPRVIPGLIAVLDVYDDAAPDARGDKPESITVTKIAMQSIPVVFVRLNATDAVPVLKKAFETRNDFNLRHKCAYALGYLLDKDEKKKYIEAFIQQKNTVPNATEYIRSFGKGMADSGDIEGQKYGEYFPKDR